MKRFVVEHARSFIILLAKVTASATLVAALQPREALHLFLELEVERTERVEGSLDLVVLQAQADQTLPMDFGVEMGAACSFPKEITVNVPFYSLVATAGHSKSDIGISVAIDKRPVRRTLEAGRSAWAR